MSHLSLDRAPASSSSSRSSSSPSSRPSSPRPATDAYAIPGAFITNSHGPDYGIREMMLPPMDVILLVGFAGTLLSILALATPASCPIHTKPLSASRSSPLSEQHSHSHSPSTSSSLAPTPLSSRRRYSLPSSPSCISSDPHRHRAIISRSSSRSSDDSSVTCPSSSSSPPSSVLDHPISILHSATSSSHRPPHAKRVSFSDGSLTSSTPGPGLAVGEAARVTSVSEEFKEDYVVDEPTKTKSSRCWGKKRTKTDVINALPPLSLDNLASPLLHDRSPSSTDCRSPGSPPSPSKKAGAFSPTAIHFRNPFTKQATSSHHASQPAPSRKEIKRTRPYEDGFPTPS